MDFNNLIKLIEENVKESFKEIPYENIANLGAKKGEIAKLERNGEYHGIAIEFMEDVQQLLTDKFVIKILKLLKKEEFITIMNILNLTDVDQIYYVLHKWFSNAVDIYGNEFNVYKKDYHKLDNWIKTVRSDPLLGKIKIIEIGQNTNTNEPVVPPEWLNREFDSGVDLHLNMDKLETRIGKPPVTYAIIYSMTKQKINTIVTDLTSIKFNNIFYLKLNNGQLESSWATTSKKGYTYVVYDKLIIGFIIDDILEKKTDNSGEKRVGLLVSRLQKSIRRGRYGRKILEETIDALNIAPNYNLPEHNFMRVSAAKQLVWRLFISILEDCRPYENDKEASLLDLILLVLITNRCLEYKFTPSVLKLIKQTAVYAQYNDTQNDLFNWRILSEATKTPLSEKSTYHTAISLALSNVIMMSGDNTMLKKLYSAKNNFEPFDIPDKYYHDDSIYNSIKIASMDHHCSPNIILYYQACIKVPSMTTKEVSSYIWNKSSSYNIRSGNDMPKEDLILTSIQEYLITNKEKYRKFSDNQTYEIQTELPNDNVKRSSFLVLFGEKYKYMGSDVVLSGTLENPIKIKIKDIWEQTNKTKILGSFPSKYIKLTNIDPPFGYQWKSNKVLVSIKKGIPYINNVKIPFFDGSNVLKSISPIIKKSIDNKLYNLMLTIFSGGEIKFNMILKLRNMISDSILNWMPNEEDISKLNMDLVRLTYIKIFNQFDNIIMIGPLDRLGNKMANSINYLLEGKLWTIFNFLSYMYPDTLKPHGSYNFSIVKSTSGYVHMVTTLKSIIYNSKYNTIGSIPKIVTPLWEHQIESVNRIVDDFNKGYHGKGDASDVGSGKTLTSLGVAVELIKDNTDSIYSGILIMLPGNKLIKTWEDELMKHTENFDIKFQKNNSNIGIIKRNTIVITTMGKMRDHPISHRWLLVVIDECLTVQNKNALQTEEAWKQSMISKHILLMSATFFRTRFDKLYYMLKMLQSGLPENKSYLDTILLETIVSKISNVKRTWETNINYFELDDISRKEYDKINGKDLSVEIKYAKLNSYLISNGNVNDCVIKNLKKLIVKHEKNNDRCLIYARSNEEATLWSNKLKIDIYPTKGKHVIITYNDGTYGLNDLVIYNTIIMRPLMSPDKVDQIKGRLDRPGQQLDKLQLEYFILKDTIEEGLIIRLNMCSQFVKNYIMPLSKFYDISVNHENY